MGAKLKLVGASGAAGPSPDPSHPSALLQPWTPGELRYLPGFGDGTTEKCERNLARLARIQASLDVAIAEGLDALCFGDRLVALGFSRIKDYAREVLDLAPRTTQALLRLGRGLRTRPLLRAALRRGELRIRHAETILEVAVGDAEARWVERARRDTVRGLEAAVRRERAGGEPEEEWLRFRVRLSPEDRDVVDRALELAGKVLPGAPRAARLEAIAQEYLCEHPLEVGEPPEPGGALGGAFQRSAPHPEALEARLEEETDRWSYLDVVEDVTAPDFSFDALSTELDVHARLCALAAERQAWDRVFGHCALVVKKSALWRTASFGSFDQYCRERLGLSLRAVEQRIALEQRLWGSRALREARDAGLSYERLRLLARLSDRDLAEWIERARTLTVAGLRDALTALDDAQMRARRIFRARVPARVASDLQSAIGMVRKVEGRLLSDGKCLARMAERFREEWEQHVPKPRTISQRVRERDGCQCQVPGCSRRAVHSHHIIPRWKGGSDDPSNLVPLCAIHHLRAVHGGHLRVRGQAPDALVWEVGPSWAPVDLRKRCLDGLAPFVPPMTASEAA